MSAKAPHDADFEKYAHLGAYHWKEIGGHWIYHNAYTAERYRRVIDAAGPLEGVSVLDYGCGDGALLGLLSRAAGSEGRAVGLDPNHDARRLAELMLGRHGLSANVVASPDELAEASVESVPSVESVVSAAVAVAGVVGMVAVGAEAEGPVSDSR